MGVAKQVDQSDIKNQLAAQGNKGKPVDPGVQVAQYFKGLQSRIAEVLPKHVSADTLTRIAITEIRTNPRLLECSLVSLAGAVMKSAQLGLQLGLLGHCYLVPYKQEATFILGYKGMIELARRSGAIKEVYAVVVNENDEFEIEFGIERKMRHVPNFENPGSFKGAYAVAHFTNGGFHFEYLPKIEIEKRRKRSKAATNGPWVTDYEEMAKKTVIRHIFDYLPVSVDIMRAAYTDETAVKEIYDDGEMIDVTPDFSVKVEETEEESKQDEMDFSGDVPS
ncbi:recombinase RecT [Paenibacillus tarimensis]